MFRLACRRSALAQRTPALASSTPAALRAAWLSTSARRAADPWLLPNMPGHLEKTTSGPDAPAPEPLPRPGESVERMRARLVYQSRKRGTLESDLLLSTFAEERVGGMGEEELREFDKVRRFALWFHLPCTLLALPSSFVPYYHGLRWHVCVREEGGDGKTE